MTIRAFPLRVVVAVVVLALAALGYDLFVKQSHYDTNTLAELVIPHPGVAGLKPVAMQAQVVPTASSTYPTVKKLGLYDANHTGSYGATWQGTKTAHNGLTLLADLLPTHADARKVRAEAAKLDLAPDAFSSNHFTFLSHFSVPGVPGAVGSAYSVPASSTSTGGSASTVVFRFNRVVVSELVETGTKSLTKPDVVSVARSEYSLLQQVEPGFSMQVTTRPTGSSIVYGIVSLVLVALVLVVPSIVRRRRAVRHHRRADRARYQYRARGRRVVRRQRTPEWSRPRR